MCGILSMECECSMKDKHKKTKNKKMVFLFLFLLFLVFLLFGIGYFYRVKTKENINAKAVEYFESIESEKDFGKEKKQVAYSSKCASVIRYPILSISSIDQDLEEKVETMENAFYQKYKSKGISLGKIQYYLFIDYETFYGVDDVISVVYHQTILDKDGKVISEKVNPYHYTLQTKEEITDTYIFISGYEKKISTYLENYYKEKEGLTQNYADTTYEQTSYNYILTSKGVYVYLLKKDLYNTDGIEKVEIPFDALKDVINLDVSKKVESLKETSKEERESFKEDHKKVFIKQKTNVYEKNNKNSTFLGVLNKGDYIEQIAVGDHFIKVKYQKKEGYISLSSISYEAIAKEGYALVDDTILLKKGTVIYVDDSSASSQITTLSKMKSVVRIGKTKDWHEILYEDSIAFVKTSGIVTDVQGKTPISISKNRKLDPNKPMVALTFDDGPNPTSTNKILDVLEQYGAVATFFDLANLMEQYPSVVQREEEIGCEVGTHTYSHVDLTKLSIEGLQEEMDKSSKVFNKVLGHDQVLVRAPYGSVNNQVRKYLGYPMIGWDIDTLDWKYRNKDKILNEVRKIKDYDGRIILMHSIYNTTAEAVEVLVPELINKGYQLVTVSELAKYNGYDYLNHGTVYYSFR